MLERKDKVFFVISRNSKLFYNIKARKKQFNIAFLHSIAPTASFHQSCSSLMLLLQNNCMNKLIQQFNINNFEHQLNFNLSFPLGLV